MSLARGRRWEAAAGEYLQRQGLAILARGYRCRLGELDLVCREAGTLVVVEVRARAARSTASAAESISTHKRARIVQATRHLLMRHPAWHDAPIRFDVLAFDEIDEPAPRVTWIRNAFDAS